MSEIPFMLRKKVCGLCGIEKFYSEFNIDQKYMRPSKRCQKCISEAARKKRNEIRVPTEGLMQFNSKFLTGKKSVFDGQSG